MSLSFTAPAAFLTVWRQTQDLGRAVLGRDAATYEVIEALLAENGWAGRGDPKKATRRAVACLPRPAARMPRLRRPVAAAALTRAHALLEEIDVYRNDLATLLEGTSPADAHDALTTLIQLRRLHAPLRIHMVRLVRSLSETRAAERFGYARLSDFIEDRLGISERYARNLVRQGHLYDDHPRIMEAFGLGEIGARTAHRIGEIALRGQVNAWLRRARNVTQRQFVRESILVEMLGKCDRRLASRFRGPLPQKGLEETLAKHLCRMPHWSRERIEELFAKRRIGEPDPTASHDPAENPTIMRRLELLVELVLNEEWDGLPEPGGMSTDKESSLSKNERHTFSPLTRMIRIHFWAPEEVAADWRAAIEEIRNRLGRGAPVWVAAVCLFASAAEAWNRHDPQRTPSEAKTLERDGYRCQAPGCTRRRGLEVHHIRFRSAGGGDGDENKLTLCHIHHRHVIHAGFARLRGIAPQTLHWTAGVRSGFQPLMEFRGERIVHMI